AAHGVPYVHEADGPRGVGADAFDEGPLGAKRREVVADAAALLHRPRRFLHVLENRAEVILDLPHDEAVEQRHLTAAAGPRDDAPGGQELEIGQCLEVALRPALAGLLAALLYRGCRACDPAPSVLQRPVDRHSIRRLEPVLLLPDELRYGADAERIGMHDGTPFRTP